MSASLIAPLFRNNLDFTDENLTGLYTSFENQQQIMMKNRQKNLLMSTLPRIDEHQQVRLAAIGTRSIDISLAKSTKPKGTGGRANKQTKDSEPIDFALQTQTIPADVPVYTLSLDSSKLVCFYGRENFLSGYFTAPMTVNGVAYRTIEHYYEACKLFSFGGFQWSQQLNIVKDPGAAKVTSKRLLQLVDKRRIEAWKRSEGISVIENALMQKFTQHSDLADKLLETGDSYLAHCNPYDTFWGTGLNTEKVKQWAEANPSAQLKIPRQLDVNTLAHFPTTVRGQNVLGYLLMQVRRRLAEKRGQSTEGSNGVAVVDDHASKQSSTAPKQAAVGSNKPSSYGSPSVGGGANDSSVLGPDSNETVHKICVQLAQINVQKAGGI